MRTWRRLGEIVVEWYRVPQAAIDVLIRREEDGLRLGDVLVRTGILTESELMRVLAHQLGVPILCTIDPEDIPWNVRQLVPLALCARRKVCPIATTDEGGIVLVMVDPTDFETLLDVERMTGTTVFPVIAPERSVLDAIAACADALSDARRNAGAGGVVLCLEEPTIGKSAGVIPLGLPITEASTLV
jgi:type IV pilus assembly protein PilB